MRSDSFPPGRDVKTLPAAAKRTLKLFDQLTAFERLDYEKQQLVLANRLKALLKHAKSYAPFWTQRLAEWEPIGATPEALLADLQQLTRESIRSNYKDLVADFPGKDKRDVGRASTSGSTGTPVTVEILKSISMPAQHASNLSECYWNGLDPTKSVGVFTGKVVDEDHRQLGTPFSWFWPDAKDGFSRSVKNRDIDELYDICAEKKPDYLFSGATFIARLAEHAIKTGRRDVQIEVAFSYASAVTQETRDLAKEGLGAKIIDRYSTEETGMIARQCPEYDHLHVLTPFVFVEIVREDGTACAPGEPGRILLTSLISYGMPLIRYDVGDIAEWGPPCKVGISFPVIEKLWGRTYQRITNPDGSRKFVRIFARDFEDIVGLEEYRFVLHQGTVVVAQLKVKRPSPEISVRVTETVQRLLEYAYPVEVRYVESIDWGRSEKRESFGVSDAPP